MIAHTSDNVAWSEVRCLARTARSSSGAWSPKQGDSPLRFAGSHVIVACAFTSRRHRPGHEAHTAAAPSSRERERVLLLGKRRSQHFAIMFIESYLNLGKELAVFSSKYGEMEYSTREIIWLDAAGTFIQRTVIFQVSSAFVARAPDDTTSFVLCANGAKVYRNDFDSLNRYLTPGTALSEIRQHAGTVMHCRNHGIDARQYRCLLTAKRQHGRRPERAYKPSAHASRPSTPSKTQPPRCH